MSLKLEIEKCEYGEEKRNYVKCKPNYEKGKNHRRNYRRIIKFFYLV